MKIDIGKVVVLLYENYKTAVENKSVHKPISYALYSTWKYVDSIEKKRDGGTVYDDPRREY